jgi:hypothetical protein
MIPLSLSIWTMLSPLGVAAAAGQPPSPVAPEEAFRQLAAQRAAAQKGHVQSWYAINLDDDPAPERVAVLCTDRGGAYLIEKGGKQRWEIGFDVDGNTGVCQSPPQPPQWERRKGTVIEHQQGHRGGYNRTSFALRAGAPAVVTAQSLEDVRAGDKPERIDFDKLVKSGKRKGWPAPDDKKCEDERWCQYPFTLTVPGR